MTYTIPNDQPAFPIEITPVTEVLDAEGEQVAFVQSLESTNPDVISIAFNDANNPAAGAVCTVGRSGVATLDYVVTVRVGRSDVVVKHAGATFVVTTGAPVTVTGGAITIPGLTPDPEE